MAQRCGTPGKRTTAESGPHSHCTSEHVIAYVLSRFPEITQTFVINEIVGLGQHGIRIEVFPLILQLDQAIHDQVRPFARRTHYRPLLSGEVWRAQIYWLRIKPISYLRTWAQALVANATHPGFLARSLVVVPKAAYFARKMVELGVTYIHAHWATHATLAAYCVSRLTGLSYSFTTHAHDLYGPRPMLARKVEHATLVVTISDYNKRLIARLYGVSAARKTAVVRCGVNLAQFRPQPPPQGATPLVVCIGSLMPYKGHKYLIEACRLLQRDGVTFRCVCIGEGPLRSDLQSQIETSGASRYVLLRGALSQQKVRRILGVASLYVQPSIRTRSGMIEGIPVAIMEALAMEIPVVASRLTGIPELIEDNECGGRLVEEKNPEALAEAITAMLRDREHARTLARLGRQRVLAEYDLDSNVGALRDRLLSVMPQQSHMPADAPSMIAEAGHPFNG